MNSVGGFHNKLRWKCAERGCFNDLARPKIELFSDCFPRYVCMGDIDGCVELRGHTLVLEWKRYPKLLATGQRKMFDRWLTLPGNRLFTILCVAGNAQTMEVTHAMQYTGPASQWMQHDFESCRRFVRKWVRFCLEHPNA